MPGRVEPVKVSHYQQAEELLGSGVLDDKIEGIGHAFLALVDELARNPNEHPVPTKPDQDQKTRSWQP